MTSTIMILGFAKVFRLVEFPSFDRQLPGKVISWACFGIVKNNDDRYVIIIVIG